MALIHQALFTANEQQIEEEEEAEEGEDEEEEEKEKDAKKKKNNNIRCLAQLSEMAVSRLPYTALSLKQFLQRQKILGIYRDILRTIREIPDEGDRKYLRDWARDEFKKNKNSTNQDAIRMMITQANNHLEALKKSLALASS